MKLTDWLAELERRAAQAEAVGATAPLALTYRAIAAEAAAISTNGQTVEPRPDRLLRASEVAERMAVKARYIYAHAKDFPFTIRLPGGDLVRFSEAGLERFLLRKGVAA